MGESTNIEWAQHTGGPYLGCDRVSPGCQHCYAADLAETRLERIFRGAYQKAGFDDWQTRPVWGRNATRVLTKQFWHQARSIHAAHVKAGTRGRWFPSMIDWLDEMPGGIIDQEGKLLDPIQVLADFLQLVQETPSLDWLLLTKRPQNWKPRLLLVLDHIMKSEGKAYPWLAYWLAGTPPANVWIGASVEDQQRADQRVRQLVMIPAVVRFLSCEPLLGPVDLHLNRNGHSLQRAIGDDIHWVIVGGESGKEARPMHPAWACSLLDQCLTSGVAFFFKQWGEWVPGALVQDLPDHEPKEIIHLNLDGTRAKHGAMPLEQRGMRIMCLVGKKIAGRTLQGAEWNEIPNVIEGSVVRR